MLCKSRAIHIPADNHARKCRVNTDPTGHNILDIEYSAYLQIIYTVHRSWISLP